MSNPIFSVSPLILFGLMVFVSLSSCSTVRKAGVDVRKDSPEFLFRKLEAQYLEAKWFEAKARIDFDDGTLAVKASATIRMKKDSAVWVAIRKLGFEVARVLITTDSLFVIDRFNNEFGAYGLDYLGREYHLPANLRILQNLLLGNPVFLTSEAQTIKPEGLDFWLEENNSEWLVRHRVNGGSFRLEALEYKDLAADRQVAMALEEYGNTSGKHNFSYLRNLTLDSQETGKIKVELKFSEVELNVPKSLSFEIPSRYSRMQ